MEPTRTYSSAEVAARASLPYRSLMRYASLGLLHPQRHAAKRGVRATWSEEEVRVACLIGQLASLGLTGSKIEEAVRRLRADDPDVRIEHTPTGPHLTLRLEVDTTPVRRAG